MRREQAVGKSAVHCYCLLPCPFSINDLPSRTQIHCAVHDKPLVMFSELMRVIIPPLASQYLNLTNNSSLAVAIGYPDLMAMGGTVLNQTGQAIEIIAIWMAAYLTLSLLTSAFMNWFNYRMRLAER